METTELSAFFRSVSSWPKSEGDLISIAERLCRLIDTPFAAVISTENGESIGFKFANIPDTERVSSDAFGDFLKKQIRQADPVNGSVKQIQLSREKTPWAQSVPAHFLSIVAITAENKGPVGSRETRVRRNFGWVVVGTAKALTTKDEILLMAVANHLSELAVISQLESAVQLRNQFLSIASHELKTPLTSIYGILQLQERMLRVKKAEPDSAQMERQHSFLKMVIRQVERLNELINGLLDVSRIQNNRFMVEPSDTDVAALLQEAINSRLHVIAEEAGVKLQLESPERLSAWVDPVRMEEVVNNLVMNAIRFSPEGGVVWIRLLDDNGALRLIVRDQGPSLAIEDRERIFQPFERAQRTSRLGGLGLGLFISRQIAQLHGGNVSLVESVPGKGNVFEAYFPLKSASLASASA